MNAKKRVRASALTELELLALLANVHNQAATTYYKLRITGEPSNVYALMLYFTLIECARSILVLRQHSLIAGVSGIARCALDAFVDLKNLLRFPTYWRNLEAADAAAWKKILETASVPTNQFLSAISNDPRLPWFRKEIKKRLAAAATNNAPTLDAETRFEKASLTAEYKALWRFLSADHHNNISSLRFRHTQRRGGKEELKLYSGGGGYSGSVALTLSEMIMFASEYLHDEFGTGIGSVRGIRAIVEPALATKKRRP
jgi:hypothetical protein